MVGGALDDGRTPIVLGGDHSIGLGTLGGLAARHGGPGGVLWIDAHGVGTPVRGGLTYREAHLALELVAESELLCCLEIVEVNPILDRRNATAALAVDLAASAFGARTM